LKTFWNHPIYFTRKISAEPGLLKERVFAEIIKKAPSSKKNITKRRNLIFQSD
jgi:hypothetical protein